MKSTNSTQTLQIYLLPKLLLYQTNFIHILQKLHIFAHYYKKCIVYLVLTNFVPFNFKAGDPMPHTCFDNPEQHNIRIILYGTVGFDVPLDIL